uniref:Uncharacterized protein n=1 Tax=Timema bartmani TaxID=61472 RepID=A0A7R9HZ95_9NEOP|nr:unnamed protein product [Timema bartmani]
MLNFILHVDVLMYVRDLHVKTGVLVSKHPLNQVFGVDVKVRDIMETAVKMVPRGVTCTRPAYCVWSGLTLRRGLTTVPSSISPSVGGSSMVPRGNTRTFSAERQLPDDPRVPRLYSTSTPSSNFSGSPSKLL